MNWAIVLWMNHYLIYRIQIIKDNNLLKKISKSHRKNINKDSPNTLKMKMHPKEWINLSKANLVITKVKSKVKFTLLPLVVNE